MLGAINLHELWEEVGAALEEGDMIFTREEESVTGVRAGHLHTHQVLLCRKISAWLAIAGDLPAGLAGLTPRAVPDHEELRVWHIGLSPGVDEVAEQNEATDYHGAVAAARHILILSIVSIAGTHHEGEEADGDEENPEDLPDGHF